MLLIFGKKYKAISNLFVETIEGESFVFPAPLAIHAEILDGEESFKTKFEIKNPNVQDSIFSLGATYLSLLFYGLNHEYKIDVVYIENMILDSDISSDMFGYKGNYSFISDNISMNIGTDEIFDKYKKLKDSMIEYEWVKT